MEVDPEGRVVRFTSWGFEVEVHGFAKVVIKEKEKEETIEPKGVSEDEVGDVMKVVNELLQYLRTYRDVIATLTIDANKLEHILTTLKNCCEGQLRR